MVGLCEGVDDDLGLDFSGAGAWAGVDGGDACGSEGEGGGYAVSGCACDLTGGTALLGADFEQEQGFVVINRECAGGELCSEIAGRSVFLELHKDLCPEVASLAGDVACAEVGHGGGEDILAMAGAVHPRVDGVGGAWGAREDIFGASEGFETLLSDL